MTNLQKINRTVATKPFTKYIERQRLKWFGHLMRMNQISPAAKAYTLRLETTRGRGRPRRRWIEGATGACPTIVSRASWGARAPTSTTHLPNQPVQYAFIHHATGSNCHDRASCVALVKGYQNYHMDTHGWGDIGYSFIIGGDGSIYEGRGWDRVGAHTLNYNSVGLGFCLTGEFTSVLPPKAQTDAVHHLLACGVTLGKLRTSYTLRGHRDMDSTACPGTKLYNEIKTWAHY